MLSREATNNNFIVFALTPLGLKPTLHHAGGVYTSHYHHRCDSPQIIKVSACDTFLE